MNILIVMTYLKRKFFFKFQEYEYYQTDSLKVFCITEGAEGGRAADSSTKYNSAWLRREVERQFTSQQLAGMSVNDLCSAVFDILSSSKQDDALQNDVSDNILVFDILSSSKQGDALQNEVGDNIL